LREYGLPEDLVYVAMIESGFSPVARSRTAAVGYWQFMRSTARTYGLTVNAFIDERRDPVLSTRAAAEYFKALYNLFGSWHLALASYNSGENRVKSVVMRNFTRDFWELVRLRKVPPETQNYVPKFIAAALIAKDPQHYGFSNIQFEPMLNYDTVAVANPISLKKMATNLAVSPEELELLNPKYRSDYVPVYHSSETLLRVPTGMKDRALAVLELSTSVPPRNLAVEGDVYRVRRGDTLSTIAARHSCSVATLQRLNNLRNHTLLRIGQKIHVPEEYGGVERVVDRRKPSSGVPGAEAAEGPQSAGPQSAVDTYTSSAQESLFHVVKKGENLSVIAKHYNTTVGELRRLNKLGSHKTLRAGVRLMIRQPNEKVQINGALYKTRALAARHSRQQFHVVKRGETLTNIARHYRVPLADLVAANDLGRGGDHRVLFAGRSLRIP
jgi:membrane-bound lytic murein transglycosylase D